MTLQIVPKDNKRMFVGLVLMRLDNSDKSSIKSEVYSGWYRTIEEAKGDWISQVFDKEDNKGYSISSISDSDITDLAASGFVVEETLDTLENDKPKTKISNKYYQQVITDWHKKGYPLNPQWRLGQFLMNHFYPGISDAEIFYEKDNKVASTKFVDKYVLNDD